MGEANQGSFDGPAVQSQTPWKGYSRMSNSWKKYLVGITSGAMLLASVAAGSAASASSPTQGAAPFTDVTTTSTPYAQAINFLAAAGVVNGVGGGLYDPNAPVTRAEMAKLVVDMLGDANFASALSYTTPSFTDASSIPSWAIGDVNLAASLGIIDGFPNGSFEPNADVTLAQAVAMVLRALDDEAYMTANYGNDWPGSYVVAAGSADLSDSTAPQGLITGLQGFIASAPATRGQVAQLVYQGAVNEVYQADTLCSGTPTTCSPLAPGGTYDQGAKSLMSLWSEGVPGLQVYTGELTGWSSTEITTMSNGTSTTSNLNSGYQLIGLPNGLAGALYQNVIVLENPSLSDPVLAVELAPNQATNLASGTLASSNVGNYTEVSVTDSNASSGTISVPWLVENPNNNNEPAIQLSNGDLLDLTNSSGVGDFTAYVNVPSTGPESSDAAASIISQSEQGYSASDDLYAVATGLNAGDSIQYATNASSEVTAVYDTHVTYPDAVITATGSNGTGDYITIAESNAKTYTVYNDAYTQVTLNGVSSSWSNLADNMVVNVDVAGGSGYTTSGTQYVTSIDAYNATATGTVTQVDINSSGSVTSFSLEDSAGTTTSYNVASNFQQVGEASVMSAATILSNAESNGATYTVYLDGSGDAAAIAQTSSAFAGAAAWVTGVSYVLTPSTTSGTTYYATLENGSATTTVEVPTSAPQPPTGAPSGASCLSGSELFTAADGHDVPVVVWGTNPTTCISPVMTQITTSTFAVAAVGTNDAVIAPASNCSSDVCTTFGSNVYFVSGSNGAVISSGNGNLGYSGLVVGDQIDLYQDATGSFFVIQDLKR